MHQNLSGAGTNTHAQIDTHIASTSNPHNTTKAQVGLGSVDNVQQMPLTYLDTDGALAGNSDVKVASQKAAKTYVDTKIAALQSQYAGGLLYQAGGFDGTKTIATNGITTIKKGYFWKVTVAGSASGITTPSSGTGLNIGDMIIANQDATTGITAAMFDGIDNSESADLVKLAATQTLTNKTINADNNTISNLEIDNFKTGVVKAFLDDNVDTEIPTVKAVKAYADSKVKMYSANISLPASTSFQITNDVHHCGNNVVFQLFDTTGNQVECDSVMNYTNGTLSLQSNSAFDGRIVITGVLDVIASGMPT